MHVPVSVEALVNYAWTLPLRFEPLGRLQKYTCIYLVLHTQAYIGQNWPDAFCGMTLNLSLYLSIPVHPTYKSPDALQCWSLFAHTLSPAWVSRQVHSFYWKYSVLVGVVLIWQELRTSRACPANHMFHLWVPLSEDLNGSLFPWSVCGLACWWAALQVGSLQKSGFPTVCEWVEWARL